MHLNGCFIRQCKCFGLNSEDALGPMGYSNAQNASSFKWHQHVSLIGNIGFLVALSIKDA